MTPAQRAAQLVKRVRERGWVLEFVEQSPTGAVHVVGPEEDQPGYDGFVDFLISRRFRYDGKLPKCPGLQEDSTHGDQ